MSSLEELWYGSKPKKKRRKPSRKIREAEKWKRELKRKGVTYTRLPKRQKRKIYRDPIFGIPVKRRRKKSPFDLV
jgi:hypothetical protein